MQGQSFALISTLLLIVAADYGHDVSVCGPNEEFTDCYGNCGSLCSQMGQIFSCPAQLCGQDGSTDGCVCKKGYLRAGTPTSLCVPLSECPCYNSTNANKCGPHQTPIKCYTDCGDLCSQQGHEIHCPLNKCDTEGCVCEKGYARITSATSRCIPISQCKNSTRTKN